MNDWATPDRRSAGPTPDRFRSGRGAAGEADGFSRRSFLRGGAFLAGGTALMALGGCGAVARPQEQLSFWHLLTGSDGRTLTTMIDDFTAANTDVKIRQTILGWGSPYYTKLAMASAGGRAPDIAVMHSARVPGYAPGGLLDAWDADLLADLGVSAETVPELVWKKGLNGDRVLSVAMDTHPFVLYYDKSAASTAGVLDAGGLITGADSPEGFRDVALAMAEVTGGHGLAYGFLNDPSNMWRMFYTWYKQTGAEMSFPEGGTVQLDRDAAMTSLEWIVSLLDDEVASSSNDGGTAISEFATGRTGMFLGGVWEIGTFKENDIDLGMQVIPTVFDTPVAFCDSHSFVLPHQSSPDAWKREKSHEFVADLLKSSLQWAEAGHIPAYTPVLESPAYQELVPQRDYADAVDYVVYDPEAWFSGSGSDLHRHFGDAMQSVYMGNVKPADGLDAFVSRINTLMSRPSPV